MTSVALLDLCDSNLQLWHGDRHVQSPGYALLQGQEYRFGVDARAAARLQPRNVNTRFWWQLNTEPLQPTLGPARHTADLVHSHLSDLHKNAGEPEEIILAVPGSMQHEQLALLLGIVQQCPFAAVGLVHRSVAISSQAHGERLRHLELQLHQALLTEVTLHDNTARLQRSIPLPGVGLLQLQERLVEIIADRFVRQTRFDPRRSASDEQSLYDALPKTLNSLQSSDETNLEVGGYRARLSREDLRIAAVELGAAVHRASDAGHQILVDPAVSVLPGWQEQLPDSLPLPTTALPAALTQHQENLIHRDEALSYVTDLPLIVAPTMVPRERQPTAPRAIPTHLLRGTRADPLQEGGVALDENWRLVRNGRGWLLEGCGDAAVNGAPYSTGQLLSLGDEITIGKGQPALLIEVR
ncbi:MAG: hypothetical protein AAGA91_18865 [Pseudomonadota bacterium]